MLGTSEIHVLLSLLWLVIYKWHVISVTLLKFEISVHKRQD